MTIRRVGFWCNCDKEQAVEAATRMKAQFKLSGLEVFIDGELLALEAFSDCGRGFETCDMIMTFGGDGTLLTGLKSAVALDIPVLGINMGHVGFLTDLEPGREEDCARRLMEGDFALEERMLLEAEIDSHPVALNDATLTCAPVTRHIMVANVYVNGALAESFSGDGLIVSTPTGSTAYSFAAGGPVVQPDMELLILTPICPHTLTTRPMVVPADALIEVSVSKGSAGVLAMDGKNVADIGSEERIALRRSTRKARFIRLNKEIFYERLRSKFMDWGH